MKAFFIVLFLVSGLGLSMNLMGKEKPEMSGDEVKLMVENIVRALNEKYIYPEKAKAASKALLAKIKVGEFDSGSDFASFSHEIRSILVEATKDSGFELTKFSLEDSTVFNNSGNAGIKSEVLENNIGYLQISGNFNFPESSKIIEGHFKSFSDVDAIIIDLRSVDKGSLDLTQKMIGFFVEPAKTIGFLKSNNHIETLKAIDTLGFKRFSKNYPVYILNSSFVSGPWELFGSTLQKLNQSIIVGEVTMGVGFVDALVQVSDTVTIEMTQAIILGSDPTEAWNDQGVVPDVFSKQSEALEKAYSLALSQINKK